MINKIYPDDWCLFHISSSWFEWLESIINISILHKTVFYFKFKAKSLCVQLIDDDNDVKTEKSNNNN